MTLVKLTAAVLCACALSACHDSSRPVSATPTDDATATAPSMRVYIDPATGKPGLPPSTQADKSLADKSQASGAQAKGWSSSTTAPAPIYHNRADGTVEMQFNRKQQIGATVGADGKVHEDERSVNMPEPTP